MPTPTDRSTPDFEELVRLAGDAESLDELYRRGLEWLAEIAPYDLAAIFVLEKERLVARAVSGALADKKILGHRLELEAFPSIRDALETRRARAFRESDHRHGDGDPFDGVLDFDPGHSCMVVPLAAGERIHGVMTLDRRACETYPPEVVQKVEVYARLLGLAIKSAAQGRALLDLSRRENERAENLDRELSPMSADDFADCESAAMRDLVRRARQVAPTSTPVLLFGETGTGKERLARSLHAWSTRRDRSFVAVNCAAIPAGLLESELFGHKKGAFTGAVKDRIGRFRLADGGTLFLDEVGELPMDLQAKLLRVLQEGTLEPVGADETIKVDVRIIAATHVDLEEAAEKKRFRDDLYYRLAVFPLSLPPLRERLEDLDRLVQSVIADIAHRSGRAMRKPTKAAMQKLAAYRWPGNIRELANVLERAGILAEGKEIGPDVIEIPDVRRASTEAAAPEDETLEDSQRRHIERALAASDGKIYGEGGAAERLGLKPSTLQSRMKKLGIRRGAR